MLGFAVIPFGNQAFGDEKLQVAPLGIGVLFVMSVLSIGVYGITLGGWASNNKYSLLGSLRASAQLISYELTLGLSILMVVMMSSRQRSTCRRSCAHQSLERLEPLRAAATPGC
jgi:NADH-quinone oxidoreductase subunit H